MSRDFHAVDANNETVLGFIESILNEIRPGTPNYDRPQIEDDCLVAVRKFLETCSPELSPILELKWHPAKPISLEKNGTILLPLWKQTPAFQERNENWQSYLDFLRSLMFCHRPRT
jgi:hypothetical protein